MKINTIILMIGLTLQSAFGADKHVSPTGSNAANGDVGTPWQTFTYAESQASAGMNIYLHAGTYAEQPTIDVSGINVIGEAGTIVRGVIIDGVSDVQLINITFTHSTTALGSRPIRTSGTCSNIHFFNCIATNIFTGETEAAVYFGGTPSYIKWTGGFIDYLNPPSLTGDHRNYAFGSPVITPNHILIQYLKIKRANDYIGFFGSDVYIRNLALTDHDDGYWTNGTGHSDFMQIGSDGLDVGTKRWVIERIYAGDNQCMGMAENTKNGHFLLLQDQQPGGVGPYGDNTNFIFRGNIGFHINDGVVGVIGADRFIGYNNSFYDLNTSGVGYTPVLFWRFAVVDSLFENNLFDGTAATLPIEVLDSSVVTTSNNGGRPTHSSFTFTGDPLYVSPASPTRDFHIQSGSSARGAGAAQVTITSANGSGTSFTVDNPFALSDGKGLVEGDKVVIGAVTTYITSVNWGTSTITVEDSVSWTQNTTKVHWDNNSLDEGAIPYGASELLEATLSRNGTTNSVTTDGSTRGVWFLTNGIPAFWDYKSPYEYVCDESIDVTAYACALYSQAEPFIAAGDGSEEPQPTADGLEISGGLEFSGDIEIK